MRKRRIPPRLHHRSHSGVTARTPSYQSPGASGSRVMRFGLWGNRMRMELISSPSANRPCPCQRPLLFPLPHKQATSSAYSCRSTPRSPPRLEAPSSRLRTEYRHTAPTVATHHRCGSQEHWWLTTNLSTPQRCQPHGILLISDTRLIQPYKRSAP